MNDEQKSNLIITSFFEVVFFVFSIIYDFCLYNLNIEIKKAGVTDPFEVLFFHNNQPVHYFVIAVIIFLIGILLSFWFYRTIFRGEGNTLTVFLLMYIILNVFILIITFCLIDNPILRAVIVVIGVGFSVLNASATD